MERMGGLFEVVIDEGRPGTKIIFDGNVGDRRSADLVELSMGR